MSSALYDPLFRADPAWNPAEVLSPFELGVLSILEHSGGPFPEGQISGCVTQREGCAWEPWPDSRPDVVEALQVLEGYDLAVRGTPETDWYPARNLRHLPIRRKGQ